MSRREDDGGPEKLEAQLAELRRLRTSLNQSDRLLHELRVHQVELEIQNRALREAQEQMEQSRGRYLELYDFAPVAYLTLEPDGSILESNIASARLIGQDRALLLGRRLQTLVAMSDPLAFRTALRRALEEKQESRTELTLRTVNQQVLTVEMLVSPALGPDRTTRARVALVDVSGRAAAEQSVRFFSQAGARLGRIKLSGAQLLDEIASAGAAGVIDGCWVEIEGAESVAWRSEPVRRKMPGEQLEALRLQLRPTQLRVRQNRAPATGRWNEELVIRRLWPLMQAWATAPLSRDGGVRGTVTLLRATAEQGTEEPMLALVEEFARRASMLLENADLLQQAEHATRAREEMVAVLAHDLSNALFAFRLHAQRGLSRGGEQAQRSLAAIGRGAQWLLGLVRTVLDLASGGGDEVKVQLQRGNLAQVLESACGLQELDADERRVRLEKQWPLELPASFDQERMLQVAFNLVNNALKFTPGGGQVQVGAELGGDRVRFWVRDSGKGLTGAELKRVFERGWQAEPGAGGTGLGLYICKRSVEAHGGNIWAESAPGTGATFIVLIPAEAVAGVSPQDAPAAARSADEPQAEAVAGAPSVG
ncbi:MAG: ATP-binding protein [Myxococcaceae bacterium]